jgi:type I restriction enzyme M protein
MRKNIIEDGLLDCIINLPAKLFLNTQIPACLWFLSRKKGKHPDRCPLHRCPQPRISRQPPDSGLCDEDIAKIADTYHRWRNNSTTMRTSPVSASQSPSTRSGEGLRTHPRPLHRPAEDEDDFDFAERFSKLRASLRSRYRRRCGSMISSGKT